MNEQKKYSKIFLGGCFLSAFLLGCILFTILQITPFGENNLMVSDLGAQYTPFFSYFKQVITGSANPFYSFSITMGDVFLPLAAYYLMSPFNFIFVLATPENLDMFVSLVILLKISSIATSMYFYLSRKFQKDDFLYFFFAISFALCSYVGIYQINVMWLDGLIMAPIVLYFLEKFVKTGHARGYVISLTLTIIFNYYLGYMLCLFVVFYFISLTIVQKDWASIKDYFVHQKNTLLAFLKYSLLSGLMSAFILIPAIAGMLKTGKTAMNEETFFPKPTFGLSFFTQFGVENTKFDDRLAHLPLVYCGIFVLFLAALYFFGNLFTKKEKIVKGTLFLILFLSFLVQTFNAFWHMFQMAAGFPYRNSFLFSFLLIVTAVEVWEKRNQVERKNILRVSGILAFLIFIGYVSYSDSWLPWSSLIGNNTEISWSLLFLSLLILICVAIIFRMQKYSKIFTVILFIIFITEISYNYEEMTASIPYENSEEFSAAQKTQEEIWKKLPKKDHQWTRVENNVRGIDNGYNQSLMDGYFSIPSYSSTLNIELRTTLLNLGMFSRNERRISDAGISSFLEYLFNVNYVAVKKNEKATLEKTYKEQSSVGFAVSKSLGHLNLTSDNPFENQNTLAKIIMKQNEFRLFEKPIVEKESADTIKVTPRNKGEIYFYLPPYSEDTPIRVYVNKKRIKPKLRFINNGALLRLGVKKIGETTTIQVKNLAKDVDISESIYLMNEKRLTQIKDFLQNDRMEVKFFEKENKFEGTMNAEDDEIAFTTIPYSSFWKVEVDGKSVETFAALDDTFLSFPITRGNHEISIVYIPQDFYIGLAISLFALLILVQTEYLKAMSEKKRKRYNAPLFSKG